MNRKAAGILAALALTAGGAFAQGQQQLSGTIWGLVLQVQGQTVYIQQGAAAVPLQISGTTRFAPGLNLDALQPGVPVVARIQVNNGRDNVVQEIGVAQGATTEGSVSGPVVGGAGQAGGANRQGTAIVEPLNPAARELLQGPPPSRGGGG